MNQKVDVETLLNFPKLALVGLSRNLGSFSVMALRQLRAQGKTLVGVTPMAQEIDGCPCVASVADLDPRDTGLIFFTQPPVTLEVLTQAVDRGFQGFWIQQGAEDARVEAFLKEKALTAVTRQCIMMHAPPVKSIHSVHRFFKKITGGLPH